MQLRTCSLDSDDFREWDTFIAQNHSIPLFCSSSWLAACSRSFHIPVVFNCVHHEGALIAGMVYSPRKKGLWEITTVPPLTLYNGVAIDPSLNAAQKSAALHMLCEGIERSTAFASLSLLHDEQTEEIFFSRGWKMHHQQTIQLQLSEATTLWEGFSQSHRRKIRRARELGITVLESIDPTDLLTQHLQSYARHRLHPPFESKTLREYVIMLLELRKLRIFYATLPDGTVAAARAIAIDKPQAFDLLAGADIAHADMGASHLLVHAILELLLLEGYTSFDFMGANTPGVKDFKERFGGAYSPYWTASYHRSIAFRFAELIRGFQHRWMRRM